MVSQWWIFKTHDGWISSQPFHQKDGRNVTLGDNPKGKVIGKIGKVSSFIIDNDGLNAKGYFAIFKSTMSTIDN